MTWRRITGLGLIGVAILALLLWILRARLAEEMARGYFQSHGIASSVDISGLGLSGVSGRFALGPAGAPDISAERIELRFDPLRWTPRVVEVRLVNPVIRARMAADGSVSLPSLQNWIDGLRANQGQSRFVSEDLAVSLTGLRVFLASPYGVLEADGDLKLVRNLPVSAAFSVRPTSLRYGQTVMALKAARLLFDQETGRASVDVAGDLRGEGMTAEGFDANLSAEKLRWTVAKNGFAVAAPTLHLRVSARVLQAGISAAKPSVDLTAKDFRLSQSRAGWVGRGDFHIAGGAGFSPDKLRPLLSGDRRLANAVIANLAHLDLAADVHAETQGGQLRLSLSAPAIVRGAAGGALRVADLTVQGAAQDLSGSSHAVLTGRGLPSVTLGLPNFALTGGAFRAQAVVAARLDYAAFRGVAINAQGAVTGQSGEWAFSPAACAKMTLSAFRPGPTDMATRVAGVLCPSPGRAAVSFRHDGIRLAARMQNVSATLPLANVAVEKAEGTVDFGAGANAPLHGAVALTSARLLDRAAGPRFNPLLGKGAITLGGGVWRGKIAATDEKKSPLGEVTFTHAMASGSGSAHIAAPHIAFAAGGLQPETLSPLLVAFRQADGAANFSGDIDWTSRTITSRGHLSIANLDFLTPLGKAHAVKTELNFTSLLPPATEPGQALGIARIDWTLPFSAVDVRLGFSPTAIQIDKVSSGFAEGHASLGAFRVDLANPKRIDGAADLTSISLAALIAASNLGSKVKLEGKVSGHVPFSAGPDGFKIVNGHVQADGAGRLSIDRSLWAQGDAAVSTNAVQGFAYQALENLSFNQMTADLNSIPGGRLQIVFHIKGQSDPPKPQKAEVGLMDLLNGTALQKPIPLPSATPIDLTLDTSLNFDELLKSYSEAWSKTLQGQTD
ncbi:MAG: YdbH domain-containing protein [Pseudomonadota bacterium]